MDAKAIKPFQTNVKEAAVSWPPAPNLPISSTIAQEQQNWQIPPIHNAAEQLMQHVHANGGSVPANMYMPGCAFAMYLPGPSVPVSPIAPPDNPNKPYLGHFVLSPLSCGGFLYKGEGVATPPTMLNDTSQLKPSSLDRKIKLEKYRNKRATRNWNRQSDVHNKKGRPQNEMGDSNLIKEQIFLEVIKQLESTQKQSQDLSQKLSAMERELDELRRSALEARRNEENVKRELEYQQNLNKRLLSENQFLWETVPQDELFTTLNPDHLFVDREAFLSKIDLSDIDLVWTDSPFLEEAREKAANESMKQPETYQPQNP